MNPDKTVTELVNLSKKQVKDNDEILTFQALLYKWSEAVRAQRSNGDGVKHI